MLCWLVGAHCWALLLGDQLLVVEAELSQFCGVPVPCWLVGAHCCALLLGDQVFAAAPCYPPTTSYLLITQKVRIILIRAL